MSMPFYVAPEQVMKDRADYARKGIARGRGLVALRLRRRHRASWPRTRRNTLRKVSEIYDRIAFAGVGTLQRVRPAAGGRRPRRRPQGLPVQPRRRRRPQPGQPVRPDPRPDLHPRDEADGGRDPRGRGRAQAPAERPDVPHPLRRHRDRRARTISVLGGDADAIGQRLEVGLARRPRPRRRRSASPSSALAGPDRTLARRRPRGRASWPAATGGAASAASTTTSSPASSAEAAGARQSTRTGFARRPSAMPPPAAPGRWRARRRRDGSRRRRRRQGARVAASTSSGVAPGACARQVRLGLDEDVDRPHRVRAVTAAAQLPQHALGPQPGREHPCLEAGRRS